MKGEERRRDIECTNTRMFIDSEKLPDDNARLAIPPRGRSKSSDVGCDNGKEGEARRPKDRDIRGAHHKASTQIADGATILTTESKPREGGHVRERDGATSARGRDRWGDQCGRASERDRGSARGRVVDGEKKHMGTEKQNRSQQSDRRLTLAPLVKGGNAAAGLCA